MKAIILGAGRIGRGFVSQILKLNNFDIVHFDNSQELVDIMNENKEYTVHVMGYPDKDLRIQNVKAYHISNTDALAQEWHDADYIFTAVGGNNLKSLGATIAKAYRKTELSKISNIITCENWVGPALDIREGIEKELTDKEIVEFNKLVGVTEAAILTTGAGSPSGNEPENQADTWVQDFLYLPIDSDHVKGDLRALDYVSYESKFDDFLKQKLYTNNTSVATIAYLGNLKGYKFVSEAANDPEIEIILDEAYEEINQALIQGLNIDAEKQYAFAKRAKAKYQDRNIVDLITRIGRDPIRKLTPSDRLIGPSKIALSVGKKPEAIALATIAALFFENPEDEASMEVVRYRKVNGIRKTLMHFSDLKLGEPLMVLLESAAESLVQRGWLDTQEVIL